MTGAATASFAAAAQETKTDDDYAFDTPFVEELTEEEALVEEVTAAINEEENAIVTDDEESEEKEMEEDDDATAAHLRKMMIELDQIEAAGREGYVNEKYNYAYGEYKRGLKSLSDLIVGRMAKEDPELKSVFMARRRKFCANAAAACIKIEHWHQGLEACTLILEEGPDDEMQRRKALFRAGVCARGTGELDAADAFLEKLLETNANVVPGSDPLDAATLRSIRKEQKTIATERRQYRKFCKNMVSKKNMDSIPAVVPEGKALTEKELEERAELEEKRRNYQEGKRRMAENKEVMRTEPTEPEVMMSEDDCVGMLDALVERYGDPKIQDELREAAYSHELKFSKGFIIKTRMILAPLQQDLLVKHGFLDPADIILANVDGSPDGADGGEGASPPKAASISKSGGRFDDCLGDLYLMGEGVREGPEGSGTSSLYSVALYADEKSKASISAVPKSQATQTLCRAMKSSKTTTTFLHKLNAECTVQDIIWQIVSIIPVDVPDHGILAANISSVLFNTERASFPRGTSVRFDCMAHGVEIAIDGEGVIGGIGRLSHAFIDGYLKDETAISPSLCLSVIEKCCGGEGESGLEATATSTTTNAGKKPVAKADSVKAHFEAVRKFQHTVRYLGAKTKNKDIGEKAELCQKLAVGLLYEDGMSQTGWVSL